MFERMVGLESLSRRHEQSEPLVSASHLEENGLVSSPDTLPTHIAYSISSTTE